MTDDPLLRLGTRRGRIALAALILASGLAFLDSSVVSVALPRIGADLGGGLATLQWVLDAYLLTLGSFLLVGGSLGDVLGKRRIFAWGVAAFGVSSLLCGLAPSGSTLVAARAVQGVAAALLVPGSLSIITAAFSDAERPRAIGLWSGLSGLFTMLGPFVGGWLVDTGASGWRWVFLINAPFVLVVLLLTRRHVPELPGARAPGPLPGQLDIAGGVLAVVGLGLVAGPLIESARLGAALTAALVLTGVVVLAVLVGWELRTERRYDAGARRIPMLPLSLFRIRTVAVANLVTFWVYGPVGGVFFLVTVQLIVTLGWSALAAGAAGLPITVTLALLSGRVGGWVPRVGARPLLVAGPAVMAGGLLLLGTVSAGDTYVTGVLPGILVFAAGLVLVVAPVTSAALSDVGGRRAGAASGVNNAVARVATLLAVAALPAAAGMLAAGDGGGGGGESGGTGVDPAAFAAGYPTALAIAAGLCAVGAVTALALPRGALRSPPGRPAGRSTGPS
ncbi:MAG: MFS transporter [Candidatus Nanopelagicales bacterium]